MGIGFTSSVTRVSVFMLTSSILSVKVCIRALKAASGSVDNRKFKKNWSIINFFHGHTRCVFKSNCKLASAMFKLTVLYFMYDLM